MRGVRRVIAAVEVTLVMIGLWSALGAKQVIADPRQAVGHLPPQFAPEAARQALLRHLDEEVLPYWTDPAKWAARPEWAEATGMPILRLLRLLFVHAVAIQRAEDQERRERLREQYDHLFEKLTSGFRDPEDGAWFAATTYDGGAVLSREKSTVSQAYVIYVMAECARRISDSRARELALATFQMLEEHGRASGWGGYLERTDLAADAPENATQQLGTLMNIALALARLHRIAPSATTRERLKELLVIFTREGLVADSGNIPIAFTRDGRPAMVGDNPNQQTLYGLTAELAWTALDAAEALGKQSPVTPGERLLPWVQRVADGVIRNGIGEDGRVYVWGPLVGPPESADRIAWWPQTEVAILLARMAQLTREERYLRLLEKVLRFTFERFVPDHRGAWFREINLRDGTVVDDRGDPWMAGLHTTRMLLECVRVLEEVQREPISRGARRLESRRAVQLETGFAYCQGRSAASIVSEVKVNGFNCIHLICTGDKIAPAGLVEEAHRQGVEVWGTFFPTGVYMPDRLFPPQRDGWRMQFTGDTWAGYRFFSYVHPDYVAWWKEHLARFYRADKLDGMLWCEVHYPTQKGITAWAGPVFGDVSPGFAAAFRRASGQRAFPNFTDPQDPHYYLTDERLYRDYVEFRINSIIDFQREVLDGENGFRRRFPQVPFATWTIAFSHPEGLAALRENEAQDPARFVVELQPDLHFCQTHAPDWFRDDLPPDYVRQYTPYLDAVRAVCPDLPLGIQTDVGSTRPWRRDPEWMRAFEENCHTLGVGTTTYYEFTLRWEIYHQAPAVCAATLSREGVVTLVFDQRIDPTSCAFLDGQALGVLTLRDPQVDGNLLHLRVDGAIAPGAELEIPLGGIADLPAVRYPLVGLPEEQALGPVNTLTAGTTVTVRCP